MSLFPIRPVSAFKFSGFYFGPFCRVGDFLLSKSEFRLPNAFSNKICSKCLVQLKPEPRFRANMDRTQQLPNLPSLNSKITEIPAQNTTKPSFFNFFFLSLPLCSLVQSFTSQPPNLLGKHLISVGYFSLKIAKFCAPFWPHLCISFLMNWLYHHH